MSDAPSPLRETILRQCQAASPGSWSPGDYAAATGMSVEALYAPLNDLRLGGFVELTEWQQGKGQGYIITPLGQEVLENPTFLAQLRTAGATIPLDRVSATPSP